MSSDRYSTKVMFVAAILPLLLALIPPGTSMAGDKSPSSIDGLPKEELLKLGERMYREGILPDGEPMQALVQNDIPVDSTMFSCVSCHLRSGLGSLEGRVVTYPIDGITLYKPMTKAWNMRWVTGSKNAQAIGGGARSASKYAQTMTGDIRSAYTDETLAAVIRGGVNPDGKTLNYTMPRYPLADNDMKVLILYLKNLSATPSPGVTETSIRYATVVVEGVSQAESDAMIAPLNMMARSNRGRQLPMMSLTAIAANPEDLSTAYLSASIAQWELKGPSESWRGQLEAYYKKEPVFALLGGISNNDWRPIHEFCEENKIPCILPITELPVISAVDWYTLYVSKGFYQEGEAAAKYVHETLSLSQNVPVIQVYRNNKQGLAMAKGFEETWEGLRQQKPDKHVLTNDPISGDLWKQITAFHKPAVILLWLDSKDLSSIAQLTDGPNRPKMLFLPSTLLGKELYALPEKAREIIYITYPYRLPDDVTKYRRSVELPNGNKFSIIQAKTSVNTMLVTQALFMMKGYFYRDRFLEVMDMMADEITIPLYPRLSFGPGQRYISKGCYIVQLGEGPTPKVIRVSDWVIP